jgi:hypothetical protein
MHIFLNNLIGKAESRIRAAVHQLLDDETADLTEKALLIGLALVAAVGAALLYAAANGAFQRGAGWLGG